MSQPQRILIAGLGSPHGDDQAGWLIAENLASQCQENSDTMIRRASIPLDLLDWLEGVDVLHICDACEATESEVKLHRITYRGATDGPANDRRQPPDSSTLNAVNQGIDIPRSPVTLTTLRSRGTHDFGLPEVLQLAEATRLLPETVIIWAIEGTHFQPACALSEKTKETAMEAAARIMRELRLTYA